MGSWFYGLVEFENKKEKHIELCEIYSNGGLAQIDFKELNKDMRKLVIEDITDQLKNNRKFYWKNNKLIKR